MQVARALKASQIFGATCMRCVLGGDPERPQIEMHIDNMIKAVKGLRSRIVDSGVKLAVENHGGDLQAREMKMMVEACGTDIMGVCLDSGNPVWMLEDPHFTLETLIPYAETSHVRDSAVWKVPEGIAVRWVNMGEGNVDIDGWIRKFVQAKPGLPIIFENLVSGAPRIHKIYDPAFWDNWRKDPAWEFSRFLAVAEKGTPKPADAAAGRKDRRSAEDRRHGGVHQVHARAVATGCEEPRRCRPVLKVWPAHSRISATNHSWSCGSDRRRNRRHPEVLDPHRRHQRGARVVVGLADVHRHRRGRAS